MNPYPAFKGLGRGAQRLILLAFLTVPGSGCGNDMVTNAVDDIGPIGYALRVTGTNTVYGGYMDGDTLAIAGDVWRWQPDIGHLSLGPELTGGEPIASFWMTLNPGCTAVDRSQCFLECFFYSIGNPGGNLGEQEAYSYSPIGACEVEDIDGLEFGTVDGVPFVKGEMRIPFERNAPAIGEFTPERISVEAKFAVVQR